MPVAPFPPDEDDRVSALYELKILDTPPEERFDRLSRLASAMFSVPIAYVALLEKERQWFKSSCGLGDMTQTDRQTSLCSYTILSDETVICQDASIEPRFHDNPFVTGAPGVRFYMGHPLATPEGHRVGTFCVIDLAPRSVTPAEVAVFRDLAEAAQSELNLIDAITLQRELRQGKDRLRTAYSELSTLHEALRESQAQLIQSSKLAAIGQLAGGVAHELNTPLANILMCLDSSLRVLTAQPDRAQARLERARNSVGQMKEIIANLLFYSRGSVDRLDLTDLNRVAEDTIRLLGHQFKLDNVLVEAELGSVPLIVANANQLQQVITNLLINARDALLSCDCPDKRVVISTRHIEEGLEVRVRDWGPGIPESVQERIFDPFFTTKDVGQGTGLGLSISQQIVKHHGGQLRVHSQVGQGTEFFFVLPGSDPEAE